MIRRTTVWHMGLAAWIASAAHSAYAQPVAPAPIPPAPIASDAALVPSPVIAPAPAPIPDNIALPPVNMPPAPAAVVTPPTPPTPMPNGQVAAPAQDANTLPADAAAPEGLDIATEGQPINFDDFGASIFYKPQDVSKLKAALDIADALARKAAQGVTRIEEAIMPTPEAPKIEISEYPVFHLSSIMHHGAGKWVMWLNGNRITSKNLPPDLTVNAIGTQSVRFDWKPQIYSALEQRWKSEEGDASKTKLKKLLSGSNLVSADSKTGTIRFTLRPNQTYSSAYNAVMEGKQAAVNVSGDSGVIDVSAFEQTLRENEERMNRRLPSSINPGNRLPRVIRPDNRAGTAAQPGAPTLGTNPAAQPAVRRSGLVTPDTVAIGLVPSIFPGGVPAAARPENQVPQPAPDPGLPVLPPGAQ